MSDTTITTTTGDGIASTAVDEFQAGLRGPLLRSGNDGYDAARKLWNGMFDRRPARSPAAPVRPMSSGR
jgi:hypothetical protein